MKIKIYIYKLTDSHGNISWDVVKESSDIICIGGYDMDGQYYQFDSYEAYHAYVWAKTYEFTLECIEKEVVLS